MDSPEATLKDFFHTSETGLAEEKGISLETSPRISSVRRALEEANTGIRWPFLKSKIVEHVDDLLDIKVKDILVGGWKKYRQLQKYLKDGEHPTNETILLPLAEHTINSSHKPSLKVILDGALLESIDFEIKLSLKLKGLVLEIRGGKIKQAQTGTCQGTGSIKCEGIALVDKKTSEFKLPGVIGFENSPTAHPAQSR